MPRVYPAVLGPKILALAPGLDPEFPLHPGATVVGSDGERYTILSSEPFGGGVGHLYEIAPYSPIVQIPASLVDLFKGSEPMPRNVYTVTSVTLVFKGQFPDARPGALSQAVVAAQAAVASIDPGPHTEIVTESITTKEGR